MSEAIKIKEGGIDRSQNQINKLKTNTVGGGVCFWVPETERQTDDKRITANGIYTAEDEGLYGYDEIDVSVPNTGSMSGKGADGNDYSVSVDDNGYIVETKIPSAIQITTPPPRVSYNDGDTVDYSGIVVTLYDGNGNVFTDSRYTDGIVPFSELSFPVSKAQYEGGGGASSDLDTSPIPQPIQYVDGAWISVNEYDYGHFYREVNEFTPEPGTMARLLVYKYNGGDDALHPFWASDTLGKIGTIHQKRYTDGELTEETYTNVTTSTPAQIHSKIAYFDQGINKFIGMDSITVEAPWSVVYIAPAAPSENVAWTMVYGTGGGGAGVQTLPVNWISPYNADTYTDTFDITVHAANTESGSAHNNEGGFEGGGSEHGF